MQRITVYWRDIPAQVIVKKGRTRGKAMLTDRFQQAIDRAAMRAGKGGSDAYMEDWRRITENVEDAGSPDEVAAEAAAILESEYSDDDIAVLVKNFGNSTSGEVDASS